ncbi:MAG: right-handed parallel beta-helix repeat-containing protein, partial [Fermentimonas sp.]|nr:right-handed parallel beta-helix repeat-containing protein [Fermentimonas sp.]
MKLKRLGITILFSSFIFCLFATEIWISTDGNDKNNGTKDYPLQTLHEAVQRAREMRRLNVGGIDQGVNIILK